MHGESMKELIGIGIRRVGVIMIIQMSNRIINRIRFNRMLHLELTLFSRENQSRK
jgi:hypothetical protein